MLRSLAGAFALLLVACGGAPGGGAADGGASQDLGRTSALVAARPYQSVVGGAYDPARPTPLLLLLHGYSVNGIVQDAYFGFSRWAGDKAILYAYPDGTVDSSGKHYWNATDGCCDFDHKNVDDVAYLGAVIDDMSAKWNVDPKRVYLVGHSNGGFMAYRMACDLAPRIAAIVSLAGASWKDGARCQPAAPVAVLQIHGDADDTVPYAGGPDLPSARQSVAFFAAVDGCDATSAPGDALDLDSRLPGSETTVDRWRSCRGGAAELWTIRGGSHVPTFYSTIPDTIYRFLDAHPRP